jgi:O-antigen ligase
MTGRATISRLSLLIFIGWLLSAVCLSASEGSTQIASFTPYVLLKAASRAIAIPLLGGMILVTDRERGRPELLWRLVPLVLFAAWTMVSTLWSPLKTVTFTHSVELLMLALLAMATALLCGTEEALKRLLFHMAMIILVLCVVFLAANSSTIMEGARPNNLMQPNNMAAIAVTGLIIVIGSLSVFNWRWARGLLWPVIIICGGLTIAARSRSALVIAALIIGPVLWRFHSKTILVLIAFSIGAIATAWPYSSLVAGMPNAVIEYLMRGQTADDAYSVSGRSELWAIALDSFKGAPLLGDGYYVMSPTGSMYVWGAERWQTAHNTYIHVLTGTGLTGFVLMCWGLASALSPGLAALRRRTSEGKRARLAAYVIVSCLILGFFELSFAGPVDPMVLLFFIMVGLVAGLTDRTHARLAVS